MSQIASQPQQALLPLVVQRCGICILEKKLKVKQKQANTWKANRCLPGERVNTFNYDTSTGVSIKHTERTHRVKHQREL